MLKKKTLPFPTTWWNSFQVYRWKVKVKVTQSCQTLCDPLVCVVHGILQARILEWVAFPFSRGSSQPREQTQVSRIAGRFFTSWTKRESPIYKSFNKASLSFKFTQLNFLSSNRRTTLPMAPHGHNRVRITTSWKPNWPNYKHNIFTCQIRMIFITKDCCES